jgi:hypothetical protein
MKIWAIKFNGFYPVDIAAIVVTLRPRRRAGGLRPVP